MTLLCGTNEVAIYIPPPSSSVIPPDSAMSICRRFLEGVAGGPVSDMRIYDDRDAAITIVEQAFFPEVRGETPAFDALCADIEAGEIRVLLLADPSALGRLPPHEDLERLNPQLEIVYAATRLAEVPPADELERLRQGDADTWRARLFPLMSRRPKQRSRDEPPLVGAPRALVEVMLKEMSLSNWCRMAHSAAPDALDDQPPSTQRQAAHHFEAWLRDGAARFDLLSADPEAAYWAHLQRAHALLARGEWDAVTSEVQAAQALVEQPSPSAARLLAAAQFGRKDFAGAWKDFGASALLESLFGAAWEPVTPVLIEVGLPEQEAALRYVAFLLTRAPNGGDPELQDALDRLAAALPEEEARSLREATKDA